MEGMTLINATTDAAREASRHIDGRFGAQEHTAPELTLGETDEEAHERGVADARGARAANPGENIDAYMGGYEAELMDLEGID
jgi:hypothetical protein